MTVIEFLFAVLMIASIMLGWVAIDYLRQILDALHTANLRSSTRRDWAREERSGGQRP
jgi:phage-related holin